MICPYCKKRISKNDKFCGYCGQEIQIDNQERNKEKVCPFCGKEIFKDDFDECPYCHRIIKERIIFGGKENSEIVGEYPEKETPKERTYLNYTGFWIRFGAWVIDIVISSVLFILFWLYFLKGQVFWGEYSDELVGYVIIVVYHTFFLSVYSSTPGKMLYSLEVIDANTNQKLKFSKALARSLSYILSSIVFGLGFLWVAIDKERRQGWHDKIAKTLVIRKKKKSLILPIIASIISIILIGVFSWYAESEYDYSFEDFFPFGMESSLISEKLQESLDKQEPNFQSLLEEKNEIQNLSKEIPKISINEQVKTAEQIFEKYGRAIVTIGIEDQYGDFGLGSGFLISPTGLIITNYHVIENATKVGIVLINKKVNAYNVSSVVAADSVRDIAILKIKGQDLPYVTMGNSDSIRPGQKVFAIGNPEGFANTISDGIISQIRELKEGIKSFQITVPISMGSSGGALFNEMGEVIGITNMIFLWGQNINFAVPINYVKKLIGLNWNDSEAIPKDTSDLIFCNGIYWQPCPIGQKFHCPSIGDAYCEWNE